MTAWRSSCDDWIKRPLFRSKTTQKFLLNRACGVGISMAKIGKDFCFFLFTKIFYRTVRYNNDAMPRPNVVGDVRFVKRLFYLLSARLIDDDGKGILPTNKFMHRNHLG